MAKYIDIEWLKKKKRFDSKQQRYVVRMTDIYSAPSIDIEPKRGEWIDKGWKGDWQFETDGRGNCWHEYECSECGFHNKGSKSDYCPNCGADMRERKDERDYL